MSFLTPLFLLGLAALAVPVLIHLTQKERKSVVQFPSLMFLRKIPYESVQRRRIRDWLLLALRLAAIALIVTAFARPFLRGSSLAAAPEETCHGGVAESVSNSPLKCSLARYCPAALKSTWISAVVCAVAV